MIYTSGSDMIVPGPAASVSPGTYFFSLLGPHSAILNQNRWQWGPVICVLTSPLGDCNTHQSLEPLIYTAKAFLKKWQHYDSHMILNNHVLIYLTH